MGGEGFTHGALDGGEYLRLVAEPDLLLGRVGVHVDLLGRHRDEDDGQRVPSLGEGLAVGLFNSPGEVAVLDGAPVDEEGDFVPVAAVQAGVRREVLDGDVVLGV